MTDLTLWPTLECCIETTARREYEQRLGSILGGVSADKESQETLRLLQAFLSSADFVSLRSASERELLKGRSVRFELKQIGSDLTWTMKTD